MQKRLIKFNELMLKAIVDGRKVQTRRIIKTQVPDCLSNYDVMKCPFGRPGDILEIEGQTVFLKIHNVWIEKLQDISQIDALKEGIQRFTKDNLVIKYHYTDDLNWANMPRTAIEAFKRLWEFIYGEGAWHYNPWVWVIEFAIIEQPISDERCEEIFNEHWQEQEKNKYKEYLQ